MIRRLLVAAALAAFALPAAAQDHAAAPAVAQDHAAAPTAEPAAPATVGAAAEHGVASTERASSGDFITHHITNSYALELPWPLPPFAKEICIGRHEGAECVSPLPDFHVGPITGNLWPSKHVVMLLLATALMALALVLAGRAARRQVAATGHARGFAGAIEAVVLYIRNEVILPNVGHHGEGFVPYLVAVFFFILGMNLLGIIPYAATATGNIAVTATLAILTFLVIEIAGMRALGAGYVSTVLYWNRELPMHLRVPLALIISPIELIGKFTKPFALAIRLFANMTAGHIVILAIIGLIFSFQSWVIAGAPVLMAVAINMLELFVAFLQAFIFTMLSAVFIGQIREAHH